MLERRQVATEVLVFILTSDQGHATLRLIEEAHWSKVLCFHRSFPFGYFSEGNERFSKLEDVIQRESAEGLVIFAHNGKTPTCLLGKSQGVPQQAQKVGQASGCIVEENGPHSVVKRFFFSSKIEHASRVTGSIRRVGSVLAFRANRPETEEFFGLVKSDWLGWRDVCIFRWRFIEKFIN